MNNQDCFTYYNCVSGHCPLIIEEKLYGITCEDYCGDNYRGCNNCYFEDSDICNDCIHKESKAE